MTVDELQLLRLVRDGRTIKEAARKSGVTAGTARLTLTDVYARLGVHNVMDAIAVAQKRSWLEPRQVPVPDPGRFRRMQDCPLSEMELMALQFPADSLDMIRRFKILFDPDGLLNPGKVLPTGRGCLEIRQPALGPGSAVY